MSASAAWLRAKRRSYWDDARVFDDMGEQVITGDGHEAMTGAQWAIVYRAVANELLTLATEGGDPA